MNCIKRILVISAITASCVIPSFATEVVTVDVKPINLDVVLGENVIAEDIEKELYPSGMILPTMYTDIMCFNTSMSRIEVTDDTVSFLKANFSNSDGMYTYAEYLAAATYCGLSEFRNLDSSFLSGEYGDVFYTSDVPVEITDVVKLQGVLNEYLPVLNGEYLSDEVDLSAILNEPTYLQMLSKGLSRGYEMGWDISASWSLTEETIKGAKDFFNSRQEFWEECGFSFAVLTEPPVTPEEKPAVQPEIPEQKPIAEPEKTYDNPVDGDYFSDLKGTIPSLELDEEQRDVSSTLQEISTIIALIVLVVSVIALAGIRFHRFLHRNDWRKW